MTRLQEYTEWLHQRTDSALQNAYEVACEDRDFDRIDVIRIEATRRGLLLEGAKP